ncbi:hypothetical protein B0H14DRAFT_3605461 [Mycena olivaceomarginata]|nr:hypothetical protein B0H14DRAFT_3605461 [Mycena olivaceomarginata]
MQSLASPDTFNEVCADLKVWNTMLFPQGGSLAFLAILRIITRTEPDRNHFLDLTYRDVLPRRRLKGIPSFDLHSFNPPIDLATFILKFWFEVNNNNGSATFIVDNNGVNSTIEQDVLLFDPRRSNFSTGGMTMVVGVKDSSTNTNVTALSTLTGTTTLPLPSSDTVIFELDSTNPPADGYTFYAATPSLKAISNSIHVTINGTAYSLWVPFTSAAGV